MFGLYLAGLFGARSCKQLLKLYCSTPHDGHLSNCVFLGSSMAICCTWQPGPLWTQGASTWRLWWSAIGKGCPIPQIFLDPSEESTPERQIIESYGCLLTLPGQVLQVEGHHAMSGWQYHCHSNIRFLSSEENSILWILSTWSPCTVTVRSDQCLSLTPLYCPVSLPSASNLSSLSFSALNAITQKQWIYAPWFCIFGPATDFYMLRCLKCFPKLLESSISINFQLYLLYHRNTFEISTQYVHTTL